MSALWSGTKKVGVAALVVLLLAAIGWLGAERQARFWYLAGSDGRLTVTHGARFPPWGRVALPAGDPAAAAYAPLDLPAGQAPLPEQRFDDRQDLDRRLFDLLASWAASGAAQHDAARLAEARRLVDRAALLPGTSAEQMDRLRSLRSEVAVQSARDRVDRARALLAEARDELRQAGANAGDAAGLLGSVERAHADLAGSAPASAAPETAADVRQP